MQQNKFICELSDEELEGVIGGLGLTTNFSVGTSVSTTTTAIGNHADYVLSITKSGTFANSKAGVSYAVGFALAMAL